MPEMKTLSLETRKRILACYDGGKETRASVAKLFGVSLGMVKKLLHQRKTLDDIEPLHWRAGRKPLILLRHKKIILKYLKKNPEATLAKLQAALGLKCSLTAIHHALSRWGMTRKNRRSSSKRKPKKHPRNHRENGFQKQSAARCKELEVFI